jgi:DNA replication protein DnaC
MENNETLRKMRDMRLTGMADAFSEQLADRLTYDKIPAEARIGMITDAELDKRQSTRLTNLIKGAKLRFSDARSESMIYESGRHLDREAFARYFSCKFVEDATDIVITGPTGSGKTWMGCALAMASCKHYHTTRYARMPELLNELAAAKETGRYERVLAKYRKFECLVVDEFMLNVTSKEETRDLYELIEARSQNASTIFCSQYQEVGWLERLGGGTSAEGIVDRIANNAYRIELNGDVNMREATSKLRVS